MKTIQEQIMTTQIKPLQPFFVHHSKGHRYGTRAMAQKSLNAALAKNPALSELNPEIVPVL